MDWLLGFVKTSVFAILSGIFAWYVELPLVLSGFIAFVGAAVIWIGIQINATIKRIEKVATENPNTRYIVSDKSIYIKEQSPQLPQERQYAFIKFGLNGTVAIMDSYNISSITDCGIRGFMVHFNNPFSTDNIKTFVVGTPPKDFRFVSVNASGARVTFDETDNPIVALKFEV